MKSSWLAARGMICLFRIERHKVTIGTTRFISVTPVDEEQERFQQEAQTVQQAKEQWDRQTELREGQFRLQLESMVSGAREDAERIIEDARLESAQVLAEAHRQGYEEGQAQLAEERAALERERERMKAEYAEMRQRDSEELERVITELGTAQTRYYESLEPEVIDLVLSVAKKVTGAALEQYDDVFIATIKKALRQMKWQGKVTARVSVEAYERFFPTGSAVFQLGDDETVTARVLSSTELETYDCVIESAGETINTGIESQFKYIDFAFRGSPEDD